MTTRMGPTETFVFRDDSVGFLARPHSSRSPAGILALRPDLYAVPMG
jgi:hypothetical protein